jgi:hypothetical protein
MTEGDWSGLFTNYGGARDVNECICSTLFQRKNWHTFQGNFLESRAGAQFAFFVLGSELGHQLELRSFFFLLGLVHRKAAGIRRRKGKGKERQ